MPKTSTDAKAKILEAAAMVMRRDGALALTLEAVAKEAGVSKGGLLYHFPNKDALLQGLLEHYLENFEQSLEASGLPFAEAYVKLGSFDGSGGLLLGMMTVLALNPSLLESVRERWQRWYTRIPQTPDTIVAMLATDGIFMADILKLGTPAPELKQKTLRRMLELAKGGA
jgi:AcrR family transcriptional regulator